MINTVYELITDVMAKQYPDRVAFRYVAADGKTVVEKTYAQYVQDIRRAVTYFKENIPDIKGKRVGIMSRNCYEYGVNSFGAILAGAVVVTINQKKTWPELEYELGLVEPSLIVNDGIDYGCRPDIEAAYGDKLRPMDAFKDSAPAELVDCVGHDDLMVLMFTSGTTGRSKAVMLSERNFFTTVECQVKFGGAMLDYKHEHMPEDKNDVLSNFAILPLFHLGTFICLFVWACKGWALNLSADIRDFYRDLGLMHSDAIAVAPMLMEAIYKDVKRGRRARLNGIWNPCGSSAMFDGAMLAELAQQGMMITQVYGMTETCGDGIINYEQDEKHIRAVGKPDDHAEYKLDETGEICIRGGCVMLGSIIHNAAVVQELEALGARTVEDVSQIQPGETVVIRSHGEPVETYRVLEEKGARIVDATCPNVARIHQLVAKAEAEGRTPLIIGEAHHPEVLAAASRSPHSVILEGPEELEKWLAEKPERRKMPLLAVAQTTCIQTIWRNAQKILKKECTNAEIFDTICLATHKRQTEAAELAAKVDVMVVVGDRKSANTKHLTEISRMRCPTVYQIEGAEELRVDFLKGCSVAGLTAGASTPAGIIKEVYATMSDEIKTMEATEESFEEMLEKSFKTLNTGEKVTGIVTAVGPTEVQVDLGCKQAGYISAEELSADPSVKPEDVVKVGDEIETYIIRVNDVEGYATLSKKRLDAVKAVSYTHLTLPTT